MDYGSASSWTLHEAFPCLQWFGRISAAEVFAKPFFPVLSAFLKNTFNSIPFQTDYLSELAIILSLFFASKKAIMAPITAQMRYPVALIFINSIMITMAALAICLRLWSRRMKRTFLQFNDYIILVAWVGTIFCSLSNRDLTFGSSCQLH